ncbi:hypothetical protein CI41S_21740 [Bradyrhizobium ivorense]|nr:hypothetical protein CI41S_21740 [Bradyrhizobium ivorense]
MEPIEIVALSPPTQIGLKITYSRITIATAVQATDVRNTVARDGIGRLSCISPTKRPPVSEKQHR